MLLSEGVWGGTTFVLSLSWAKAKDYHSTVWVFIFFSFDDI